MIEVNEGAEATHEIEMMLNALSAAVSTKDARNLRRFYTDDVVIFDIFPPLSYQGADQHCANWQAWFDRMNGEIAFEFQNAAMTVNGDLATVFCINRITIGETYDLVRVTALMSKVDGDWRIAHVHTSMPLPIAFAEAEAN